MSKIQTTVLYTHISLEEQRAAPSLLEFLQSRDATGRSGMSAALDVAAVFRDGESVFHRPLWSYPAQ